MRREDSSPWFKPPAQDSLFSPLAPLLFFFFFYHWLCAPGDEEKPKSRGEARGEAGRWQFPGGNSKQGYQWGSEMGKGRAGSALYLKGPEETPETDTCLSTSNVL